jgi:hypothetical protein
MAPYIAGMLAAYSPELVPLAFLCRLSSSSFLVSGLVKGLVDMWYGALLGLCTAIFIVQSNNCARECSLLVCPQRTPNQRDEGAHFCPLSRGGLLWARGRCACFRLPPNDIHM